MSVKVMGELSAPIVVVGAGGFLASALIWDLHQRHVPIHAVLHSERGLQNVPPGRGLSICRTPTEVAQTIRNLSPSVVVNMANRFTRSEELDEVLRLVEANHGLASAIGVACRESESRILHVGSALSAPFSSTQDDRDAYEFFRWSAEMQFEWMSRSWSVPFGELLLFDTYGPGDRRGKIVEKLFDRAEDGHEIRLSPGYQTLHLAYSQDVVAAIVSMISALLAGNAPTRAWCVPPDSRTLREVAGHIEDISERRLRVVWGAVPYRKADMKIVDMSELIPPPGWQARIGIEEGLRRVWESRKLASA